MVGQQAEGPTIVLAEDDRRRAGTPLSAAEQVVTGGRVVEYRPGTDNPAADLFFRRNEETLQNVTDAGYVFGNSMLFTGMMVRVISR